MEALVMQQRSVIGWVLAAAFCASVSCGGGDGTSSVPKGYGLACTSDKDCTKYELLCSPSTDKCVQCLGDSDCKSSQACQTGLCKTPQECEDSRDCSGDQVCNEKAGSCVDCLSTRDCKTGQLCSQNTCSDRPICDYTSDCTDGLVCDVDLRVCVTCRTDTDCGYKRVCEDSECVAESTSGTGGEGGESTGGTGGKSTAGTDAGGTLSGGKGGVGGTGGKGGTGGTGGTPVVDDCGGCGLGQACTPDLRCVDTTLIDDLEDCDDEIIAIEGRNGTWAADADTGINLMHGFTDPGSGWIDHTCAAWAVGGELTANDPNATFAFIGFRLNVNELDEGLAYDLSSYNGIQLKLESASSVEVVLKTTGGGYFQVILAPFAGSNLRTAPFASMLKMNNSAETLLDLSTVYEVQFSVSDPSDFGLAVHRVELY
jgi:hypothetical protein